MTRYVNNHSYYTDEIFLWGLIMRTNYTNTYYFNSSEANASYYFYKKLSHLIEENANPNQEIIALCIGSDRSTGDSLGPLTGYKLFGRKFKNFHVYGTLNKPVHAINLEHTIEHIKKKHPEAFIIAIDASLGLSEHIGYVTLSTKSLKPGLGVNKILPEVGHISITGIVNASGFIDTMVLQSTRLSTVMDLADCISNGITWTLHDFPKVSRNIS